MIEHDTCGLCGGNVVVDDRSSYAPIRVECCICGNADSGVMWNRLQRRHEARSDYLAKKIADELERRREVREGGSRNAGDFPQYGNKVNPND